MGPRHPQAQWRPHSDSLTYMETCWWTNTCANWNIGGTISSWVINNVSGDAMAPSRARASTGTGPTAYAWEHETGTIKFIRLHAQTEALTGANSRWVISTESVLSLFMLHVYTENFDRTLSCWVNSAASMDRLAPYGARVSTGTVMTNFDIHGTISTWLICGYWKCSRTIIS